MTSLQTAPPTHGDSLPRCAFFGTGTIGAPIAGRLIAAGFPVRLWNRNPAKAEPLRAAGGVLCATPQQAATGVDFACFCLSDGTALEQVLFGPNGAAAALSPHAVVIDFSTTGVAATRALSARTQAAWLDCPVSGGAAGAAAGRLVIFAGGEAAVLERSRKLLETLSMRITRFGPTGAGQAMKLCNQIIVAAGITAIAEAIALAEHLGIDATQLPPALQGGFADSALLQLFGPRLAAVHDTGPMIGALSTMRKDVGLIRAAAADTACVLPLVERLDEVFANLMQAGLGEQNLTAMMTLYRSSSSQPA